MKKIALAIALAVGAGSAAHAADITPIPTIPLPLPPIEYAASPSNWTGFYLGLEGGHTWGHINHNQIDPAIHGAELGIFAGFNYQSGHVVLGLNADVARSWEHGSNYYEYWDNGGDKFSVTTNAALDWVGSIGARVGVVLGAQQRLLFYVTGGLGWATGHADMTNIGSFNNATWLADQSSTTFVAFGPTVGIGVEAMVTPRLSIKVEYDHTWYPAVHMVNDYQMYDNTTVVDIPGENRIVAGVAIHF